MPQWEDYLRDHRVHKTLTELAPVIKQAIELGVADMRAAEGWPRLAAVRSLIEDNLKVVNASFVSAASLDRLAGALEATLSEAKQFLSDQSPDHAVTANARADEALVLLTQIAVGPIGPPAARKEFTTALEAARDFKQSLASMMKSTASATSKLVAEVDSARSRTGTEWDALRAKMSRDFDGIRERLEADATELTRRISTDAEASRQQVIASNAELSGKVTGELELLRSKLASDSEALSASLAATAATVADLKQRADAQLGDQQTQFTSAQTERERTWSASQEDRQQRTKSLIDDATTRLQTLLSESTTKFNEAQNSRSESWGEWQRERQGRFNTLVDEADAKIADLAGQLEEARQKTADAAATTLESLKADFVTSAETLRHEMELKKDEIVRLAEMIGDTGTTAGYLRAAREARNNAWTWQGLLVFVSVFYAYVAYTEFLPAMTGAFEWGPFAGRLLVSLAAAGIATYAGMQGDKYLKVERQNRKIALDLAAFGPFVAHLPQAMQEAARLQLTTRTFGQPGDFSLSAEERTPATAIDALFKDTKLPEKAIEAITEVAGKALKT